MMPPGQPFTIRHGAHRNEIVSPFEHVHQPRRVQSRQNRVLLRFRKVEAPLVDRQLRPTIGRQLPEERRHFGIEPLVVQRPRDELRQIALHVASTVVVVDGQIVEGHARALDDGAVPRHVVIADRNHLDRRIDGTLAATYLPRFRA